MDKVIPGLFIGSFRDSKDFAQLESNQITHIISVLDAPKKIHQDKKYLCIEAIDSPEQNLIQYFQICNDFIHKARLKNQNVLIHCLAGMSRSVTIAAAYIMSATTFKLKHVLRLLKTCRSIASPNEGFNKQLQYYECNYLLEERTRLASISHSNNQLLADEEYCKKIIQSGEDHKK
ncbi:dual specificity protein phosphatase 22-like [Myzus persicae]|uniref:dual specificity protein phosphatase 22-like n=1 Tax=Myzus persicae TaxID=13164 RepID=UPI000B936D82|nr:dual specificity protein phosphatase 22-like [Myzus persicae]